MEEVTQRERELTSLEKMHEVLDQLADTDPTQNWNQSIIEALPISRRLAAELSQCSVPHKVRALTFEHLSLGLKVGLGLCRKEYSLSSSESGECNYSGSELEGSDSGSENYCSSSDY
jgi:hypothetical protein